MFAFKFHDGASIMHVIEEGGTADEYNIKTALDSHYE